MILVRRWLRAVTPLVLVLAFTAGCGGSGGGSDTGTATAAPAITTQPASVSVAAGAAASFGVVATGSGLGYQWRKGGVAISGATAATLTLPAVATTDAGSYDVVVANTAGSVTSAAAALTVTSATPVAPAIAQPPASQTVAVGGSVTLSVTATGTAPLAYQWRRNGGALAGATSASYAIASATAADAGSYDVVVTNAAGTVTSAAATLTVSATATGTHAAAVTTAAQAFLGTLSASQVSTTQIAWSLDTARRWSNLPASMVARNGIAWGSLTATQQAAARTLIATALGDTGNAMHTGWQAADDYLSANGGGTSYGAGQYHIAMLGTPSATGFWLLQLSGHHLTFNLALNGTYRSATPAFVGIEPKGSFTTGGATYDPMAAQRDAVAALGAVLTGYPAAKLSGTYADLLFGANGSGNIDGTCPRAYASVTDHGLPYASLSAAHQALAQAAIRAYVNSQASEVSSELLGAYLSDAALAATYVAYAGTGTVAANGNYFRIEGPRVWIEFSVQRGIIFNADIHFHTVWRDRLADYGGRCVS